MEHSQDVNPKDIKVVEDNSQPRPVTPIPASIVKAVCAVQAGMQAVKKSQQNRHGGYSYASADDIYAALTLKMADAGLLSLCLEEHEPEIKEVIKDSIDKASGEKISSRQQWMKVSFTFVLATEEDTWTDPRARRTLIIQITGPQTFQAAQSYAEKSWLRSTFKIATGDMDLDGLAQDGDGEFEPGESSGPRPYKRKAKTTVAAGPGNPLPPRVGERGNTGSGNPQGLI